MIAKMPTIYNLDARIRDLETRVKLLDKPKKSQTQPEIAHMKFEPRGCVCPVGAESTCKGNQCPRKAYNGS
jgi:hypothetical protein